MSKGGSEFDPEAYAPVAERIKLFYHEYPVGRIETVLVRRTVREVVFKALVYRCANDVRPAATGWAAEREGDGDINTVACLENTETSAIGRALANLGFTASRQRPSAEEMALASRVRARLVRPAQYRSRTTLGLRVSEEVEDALQLLALAVRAGLPPRRAASLRARVLAGCSSHAIERLEAALRRWLRQRERAP
jgi:hypothetical protein